MEIGRQGMAGNGYTSRVWKGDESAQKADISNTGTGHFFGKIEGNHERIFQGSDA
jgi:hypothetical protein